MISNSPLLKRSLTLMSIVSIVAGSLSALSPIARADDDSDGQARIRALQQQLDTDMADGNNARLLGDEMRLSDELDRQRKELADKALAQSQAFYTETVADTDLALAQIFGVDKHWKLGDDVKHDGDYHVHCYRDEGRGRFTQVPNRKCPKHPQSQIQYKILFDGPKGHESKSRHCYAVSGVYRAAVSGELKILNIGKPVWGGHCLGRRHAPEGLTKVSAVGDGSDARAVPLLRAGADTNPAAAAGSTTEIR